MKLVWDQTGERQYETGVEKAVLFVMDGTGAYPAGVAWNGVTGVTESPEGAESNPIYADNGVYLNLISAEKFKATLEAFMYPDEFGVCDGSAEIAVGVSVGQQTRKTFGLAYKTRIGNDVMDDAFGYKIHLIYGCKATPSEKAYTTVNETPEAATMSWEISTTPVPVPGQKPSASLVIDSTKITAPKLLLLEEALFGTAAEAAYLPLPEEILDIITP